MLLDLERQTRGTNNLLRLGLALDILIDITRLEAKYESIVESTASKMSMQLSRLQQSIVSTRSGRINDESTKPLSPFIAESLRLLQVMLLRTCSPEHGKPVNSSSQQIQESDISNLKGCLSFLSDMIDVAHETSFEEAVFQVYLSLGQSMLADLHWNAIAKDLIEGMRKGLNGLTPLWQLHSGQSMDLIWSRIRPPVATTLENLEQTLLAERLAERFDALIWTSDVPLERLGQIRELITQMRVVAGVSGDDLTHSVEVGHAHIL